MVTIRNLQSRLPISGRMIKKAVLKTLSCAGIRKSGEIAICFLNDRRIRELNRRFLKKDIATDVIAFGSLKGGRPCGDIAVSTDTAARNAGRYGTTPLYETCLYVVHGVLHLAGDDDKTEQQRKLMQAKAEAILSTIFP